MVVVSSSSGLSCLRRPRERLTLPFSVVFHCQHCSLQWFSSGILACHGLGHCSTVRTLKVLLPSRVWGWAVSWLDSELGTKQHKRLGSVSVMINWNIPVSTNWSFNRTQVITTFLSLIGMFCNRLCREFIDPQVPVSSQDSPGINIQYNSPAAENNTGSDI